MEQSFLDVFVKQNEGNMETDIYYKDTDNKQYLLFNFLPYSRVDTPKLNIPFSLARRLRTIVSNDIKL